MTLESVAAVLTLDMLAIIAVFLLSVGRECISRARTSRTMLGERDRA